MNSDDCILEINIIYNEKRFTIQTENILSVDEIKEKAIENFNLKDKDKKYIKFFIQNDEKKIYIYSEKDIIENAYDIDSNYPKIDLFLLIKPINELTPLGESLSHFEINNDNKKITNIDKNVELINEDEKYMELKNIIEKLSNEIKILKKESNNTLKELKEENINIRNEIDIYKKKFDSIYNEKISDDNERFLNIIETTYNKLNKENFEKIKKIEDFINNEYKKNEDQNILVEQMTKTIDNNFYTLLKLISEQDDDYTGKLTQIYTYLNSSEIKNKSSDKKNEKDKINKDNKDIIKNNYFDIINLKIQEIENKIIFIEKSNINKLENEVETINEKIKDLFQKETEFARKLENQKREKLDNLNINDKINIKDNNNSIIVNNTNNIFNSDIFTDNININKEFNNINDLNLPNKNESYSENNLIKINQKKDGFNLNNINLNINKKDESNLENSKDKYDIKRLKKIYKDLNNFSDEIIKEKLEKHKGEIIPTLTELMLSMPNNN